MDELTSAGILDPDLRESYNECKRLNALHGKTYYLATLLLPKSKRPFVHALYGFARYADEIVDDLASDLSTNEKSKLLKGWGDGILQDLKTGVSSDHIGKALVDTAQRFSLPIEYFESFLYSMEMDLSVGRYQSYEDLMKYVYGSAAVIGLQMAPILGVLDDRALEGAKKLGIAFQLANFIRDVGEDLDRQRIYLPQDEMLEFGVTREMLERKVLTPEIVNLLKFQIARVRRLQRDAEPTIQFLEKESRPCIRAASELYCGIVDEVEVISYDIFNKRAKTSNFRRSRVAALAFAQTIPHRFSW
ncbi:MAG: phytoene/squalene synthase family protein [Actinobacteria bacterium]|nr:phytoene/squalene synthase family protein [Actinomycetota bacterium]